jgi:hypothetical protein
MLTTKSLLFRAICVLSLLSGSAQALELIIEQSNRFPSDYQVQEFKSKLDTVSTHHPEELIQVDFVGGRNVKSVYPAGDLYILLGIGKKDEKMTKDEYTKLWRVMNYLSEKGFRVMMNVKAKISHLEAAINSVETSLIMFSAHGNKTGFYDYDTKRVPSDIFENAHESLYQFVLSSCYGRIALNKKYKIPSHLKTYAWKGLTNSDEFVSFLVSNDWDASARN